MAHYCINEEIIIIDNTRRKLLITFNPIGIRVINEDLITLLKMIEEGIDEQIIIENLGKGESEQKIKKCISELLKNNIISIATEQVIFSKNNNIFKINKSLAYPLERLFLSITERCNLKCKHCYVCCNPKSITNDISLNTVKNIIENAKHLGLWQVDLTGGEIFCRNDLFDILDYLYENKFIVNLFTNATLITEEIANHLRRYKNISRIIVSFDSTDENLYEDFRQVKGSYKYLLHAMKLLKNYDIPISFNVPYFGEEKTKQTVEFLRKNYSNDITVYPIIPLGRGVNFNNDYLAVAEYRKKIVIDNHKSDSRNIYEHRFNTVCGIAENFIFIENTGNICVCPTLSSKYDEKLHIGNICSEKLSLESIWKNDKVINNFRNTNCSEICKEAKKCKGGCRCLAYIYSNGAMDSKEPIACAQYRRY